MSLCSLVSVSTNGVINLEMHFRDPNFENLPGGAHSCTSPPPIMPSARVVPSPPSPEVLPSTQILFENPD